VKKVINLIGLCLLWSNFVSADIKVRVLDTEGKPVSNAVISIPQITQYATSTPLLDASKMAPAVMDQVDKQFLPHVLIVEKGQFVVFPNSDQVRHHVYSFSKPNDFEIRLYSGNQAEPVAFANAGVAVLGCNIHDQMVGYLYIKDGEVAEITDQEGVVKFENDSVMSLQEDLVVTIWHSRLSNNKIERLAKQLKNKDENGVWQVSVELMPEVQKTSRKFKPRYQ
jgi:plastocyanin